MEDVSIDPTAPVIDLSYRNIDMFDIRAESKYTKALILSGNPLSQILLQYFPNLKVLHMDTMNLSSFDQIQFPLDTKITHLIARNNNFKSFIFSSSCETLQLLDVSQNNFDFGAEESLNEAFPELLTLIFTSSPQTRLNSLTLFKKFFVDRFYIEDAQNYAFQIAEFKSAVKVKNLQFQIELFSASCSFSVKKLHSEDQIKNDKIIISLFNINIGNSINQVYQEIVPLAKILKEKYGFCTKPTEDEISYPTEVRNQLDMEIFDKLKEIQSQTPQQLLKIITIEYQKQIGIFVFDAVEFQDFHTYQNKIQRQIKASRGITVRMQKNGEQVEIISQSIGSGLPQANVVQYSGNRMHLHKQARSQNFENTQPEQVPDLSSSQLQSMQQVQPDLSYQQFQQSLTQQQQYSQQSQLQYISSDSLNFIVYSQEHPSLFTDIHLNGPVELVHYYLTKMSYQQIMQEISLATQNLYSAANLQKLLKDAIITLNQERRQLIQSESSTTVFLKLQTAPQIVLKLSLQHVLTSTNRAPLYLPEESLDRFIIAFIQNDSPFVLMHHNPVRFVPKLKKVQILGENGVILVRVYERFKGKMVESKRNCFLYLLYKNNIIVKEQKSNEFYLQKRSEGLYKVVIQILDQENVTGIEMESDTFFVRKDGKVVINEAESEYSED
ncbi:Leucine-rich_repeat domain superfamily [Hexamita inflata]|uniref:Leucine-rich repeat domain superfamily n=1 Tax=Hexamita inflata TaxID=28002 RepID=A0AA86PKU4_9EUKA|nr:Leucine-rich repeat domain superfamily [Hexamita inflata]